MAKNNKYLQYTKSRNKTQLNIDLQQIAFEFGRLLNKKFCYVFDGGIRVEFQFKMENFYHLLGFHKLSDVTVIKMVENHKLKKVDFYKLVRDGKITMNTTDIDIVDGFEEEIVHIQNTGHKSDFGDIKANRFQFLEYRVLDMLQIKNDKLRMEAKLSALKNKFQKHVKHLPDVIELEKQEVIMVYQEYLTELKFNKEQIEKIINDNDLFENVMLPMRFSEIYKRVS